MIRHEGQKLISTLFHTRYFHLQNYKYDASSLHKGTSIHSSHVPYVFELLNFSAVCPL